MNTRSVSRNAFSNLHALAGFVVFAAFGVSCLPSTAMAQLTFNNAADFNGNGHPNYLLFRPSTAQTAIWYLSGTSGTTFVNSAFGPTIPSGWVLVTTADFNGEGHPDYVVYEPATRKTAIWYLNNNRFVGSAYGPTLPAGWSLVDALPAVP